MSAGLLREPPITDDEDIENLDEFEIELRRGLAWSILALEWCVLSMFSHKLDREIYSLLNKSGSASATRVKKLEPLAFDVTFFK
jgi:hypothetical protein